MRQRHFETANCIELPFTLLDRRERASLGNSASRGDSALVAFCCSFHLAQAELVAADGGLPLGRGDAKPISAWSIRDELDWFGRAKPERIARKRFRAVRGDDSDRHINGVLFHRYSCVLARRQREVILVRLTTGELALDGLADFQLCGFARWPPVGLCE